MKIQNEVLVRLKPGLQAAEFLQEHDAQVLDTIAMPTLESDILHLQTDASWEELRQDPRVACAGPNQLHHLACSRLGPSGAHGSAPSGPRRVRASALETCGQSQELPARREVVPNDLDERLWGLRAIQAPQAWGLSTGENGPVVAVLDTGVDYAHPDLANNLWTNPGEIPGNGIDDDGNGVIDDVHGYDATQDAGGGEAGNPHGTHCAGTIAAEGNNGQGVTGVNWRGQIMSVKIFPDDGDACTTATILRGVSYATRMGARITSNSWTGGGYNPILVEAFGSSPALHVFAAGNDRADNDKVPSYPASLDIPNGVTVAASTRHEELAFFSNYGKTSVDLAAPGHEILSTIPGNQYATFSGTSMACPHVAGVAALVAAAHPGISNEQLKDRLLWGTDPVPLFTDKVASGGRLNVARSSARDELRPGAPEDFAVRARPDSVMIAWTPTGDDGWCGQPSGYEVRTSRDGVWESADKAESGRSGPSDRLERTMLHLVPSSQPQTIHVGLRLIDKVGNRSDVKSKEVTLPASRVAFEDKLESGAWTGEGEWARVDRPGRPQAWQGTGTLTSRPIDLSGFGDSTLYFEASTTLEPHFGRVAVEVAEAGSDRWSRVAELTGNSDGWKVQRIPMHEFDNKTVQLRFRAEGAGFELYNVALSGLPNGNQKP